MVRKRRTNSSRNGKKAQRVVASRVPVDNGPVQVPRESQAFGEFLMRNYKRLERDRTTANKKGAGWKEQRESRRTLVYGERLKRLAALKEKIELAEATVSNLARAALLELKRREPDMQKVQTAETSLKGIIDDYRQLITDEKKFAASAIKGRVSPDMLGLGMLPTALRSHQEAIEHFKSLLKQIRNEKAQDADFV